MIYAIKDAANVVIKRKTDLKPVLFIDYLNSFGLDFTSDEVSAMKKGVKAVTWSKNREGNMKWSMELIDLKMISILLGSDFLDGITPISKREVLTVTTGKVTLASTPKSGSLALFTLDVDNITHKVEQTVGTPATTPNTYSLSGLQATVNTTSCPDGTKIVAYYLVDSTSTAKRFDVKVDKYPENYEIYATTTMTQQFDGSNDFVEIHVGNCKPKSSLSLSFDGENASKFDVEWTLLADENNNLATFTIIE
jgi:hypothetical protein